MRDAPTHCGTAGLQARSFASVQSGQGGLGGESGALGMEQRTLALVDIVGLLASTRPPFLWAD